MRFLPFANRFFRLVLPMISIIAVGVTGVILLHTSQALDTSSEDFAPTLQHVSNLPTAGVTSCCRIAVDSAVINAGASRHLTATVTITNTTAHTVQDSPGLQMFVVDSAGTEHPYTAAYLAPGAVVGGPIDSRASRTEQLDFDLAPPDVPMLFVYQSDAADTPLVLRLPS